MGIISSEDVAGAGEKHLPALVQGAPALVQLRSSGFSPVQQKVAAFLAERARTLGSRTLSMMSQHIEEDPFKKVIKDLVFKLMEEAKEEAEHKGWCDTELATNE